MQDYEGEKVSNSSPVAQYRPITHQSHADSNRVVMTVLGERGDKPHFRIYTRRLRNLPRGPTPTLGRATVVRYGVQTDFLPVCLEPEHLSHEGR